MQGIELSRRFYTDIVRPWLTTTAPGLSHAAALGGYGSELLSFDDETSRDHNWGPRVQLILSRDFHEHARALVAAFTRVAPATFLSEPIGWRRRPHPAADGPDSAGAIEHGLEIHTLEGRLESHFGLRALETLAPIQWLGFAEQKLLAFTSGAVFHDDDGRLTRARERMAYYPRDIWLYKLACHWRRIAEEQAFVGRTGQVGDDLGSRIIAARLARDVMRMGFLLERQYAPYAKWLGSAFARLPIAARLTPHLQSALSATEWQPRGEALAAAYLELANTQNRLGIASFMPVIGSYHERPFATLNVDDAIAVLMAAITDPTVKSLPILGSFDQVIDSTPVAEDADLSKKIMRQVLS